MRLLEGTHKHYAASQREKAQEAFGAITRPAPEPPATVKKEMARPTSLGSAQALANGEKGKKEKGDERRSLGSERIGFGHASGKEKIDEEKKIQKPMAAPISPCEYPQSIPSGK